MKETETTKYTTNVLEVGAEARDFEEISMVILFGDEAPDALRPSCYIVTVNPVQGEIVPGDVVEINDTAYKVTAVGGEVNTNLNNLGHISIVFNGASTAELAGTLYVESGDFPTIEVGTTITITQG